MLTQYFSGDKIGKNVMGAPCGAYGDGKGCVGSWWGNRREGDHWGDLGADGWIILGWIFRKWDLRVWIGSSRLRVGTGGGHL